MEGYVYSENAWRSPQLITLCRTIDITSFVYEYVGSYSVYGGGIRSISNPSILGDKSANHVYVSGNWRTAIAPYFLQVLAASSVSSARRLVRERRGELYDGNYLAGTNIFGNYHRIFPEKCAT